MEGCGGEVERLLMEGGGGNWGLGMRGRRDEWGVVCEGLTKGAEKVVYRRVAGMRVLTMGVVKVGL